MKKYFVVNDKERILFEKKYHAPYGYKESPSFDYEADAVAFVETSTQKVRNDLVVEKIEGGEVEVVYRGFWYSPELDCETERVIH